MLNDRQITLYNYLLNKNTWTNRIDILNDLREAYQFVDNGNLYNNNSAKWLTQDIKALNKNPDIRKLIIYNSKLGIKIADEDEAKEFLMRDYVSNMKRLQKHYFMQDKLNKDGQLAFVKEGIRELNTFRR